MAGMNSYKTNLKTTNMLPVSLYLQLCDLLTLSKFVNGHYDVSNDDLIYLHSPNRNTRYSENMHFVVPIVKRALCESNFWVRTPKLVNRLPSSTNFFEPIGLKPRLLRLFWNFVHRSYDVDNSQTWRF